MSASKSIDRVLSDIVFQCVPTVLLNAFPHVDPEATISAAHRSIHAMDVAALRATLGRIVELAIRSRISVACTNSSKLQSASNPSVIHSGALPSLFPDTATLISSPSSPTDSQSPSTALVTTATRTFSTPAPSRHLSFLLESTQMISLKSRRIPSLSLRSQDCIVPTSTTGASRSVDDTGIKVLNQYVLRETLGKGTSGKVKLAYDTERNSTVAIKILRRDKFRTPEKRQQLDREIAVMKRLRHKNLVSLYEVIDDPESDKLYLVMQYIDDGPLVTVDPDTLTCEPMDPAKVAAVARQLTAGLAYLHSHHIVHRDIKPENILTGRDGMVYLSDFGLSEEFVNVDGSPQRVHGWHGSPLFMAPEVHALMCASDVDSVDGYAADVYSLGVTLYLLLVGRLPFVSPGNVLGEALTFPPHVCSEWRKLLAGVLQSDSFRRCTVDFARRAVKQLSNAMPYLSPSCDMPIVPRVVSSVRRPSQHPANMAAIGTMILHGEPCGSFRSRCQFASQCSASSLSLPRVPSMSISLQSERDATPGTASVKQPLVDIRKVTSAAASVAMAPQHSSPQRPALQRSDFAPALPPVLPPATTARRAYKSLDVDMLEGSPKMTPLPRRATEDAKLLSARNITNPQPPKSIPNGTTPAFTVVRHPISQAGLRPTGNLMKRAD